MRFLLEMREERIEREVDDDADDEAGRQTP